MDYNPILSVSTAALETAAAVWTLRGPGRKSIRTATGAILLFLAGYQVVEAVLCSGLLAVPSPALSRLAFIVVAWLPPTGLLLVSRLYPGSPRWLRGYAYAMYAFCLYLVAGILLDDQFVTASVCLIVFAQYQNPTPLYQTYGIFYQSGLMGMLLISAYGVTVCKDDHQRLLLGQVLLGSLAFIVPSLVTVAVIQVAKDALPSIMCHFALLLALFLTRLAYIERRKTLSVLSGHILPADAIQAGSPG
jgi:hypothetical protein